MRTMKYLMKSKTFFEKKSYIKTFEKKDLITNDNSCYLFYGDINQLIYMLDVLYNSTSSKDMKEKIVFFITRLDSQKNERRYKNSIGDLIYSSVYSLSISPFETETEKNTILNAHLSQKVYDFKGELKLVNHEVILDTIEKDVINYNL